jgi:hypothetical protein
MDPGGRSPPLAKGDPVLGISGHDPRFPPIFRKRPPNLSPSLSLPASLSQPLSQRPERRRRPKLIARRRTLPQSTAGARAQQRGAVRNNAPLLALGPLLCLLALAVQFCRAAAHGGVLSRRGQGACCAVLHTGGSARRPFHKRHWLAAKAAAVSQSRQPPAAARQRMTARGRAALPGSTSHSAGGCRAQTLRPFGKAPAVSESGAPPI